jgi:hypothetical protein
MRCRLTTVSAIAIALAVPAGTAQAYDRLPRALAGLSPSDFAGQVQVEEDGHVNALVLSTQDAYARGRSIGRAWANDVHLRAVVDNGTGTVSWQVWHELTYRDGPRHFGSVRYVSAGHSSRVAPFSVEHWRDQCPPTDGHGSCNHVTRIGFELPEATVREIARSYRSGSREPWRLQFEDATGGSITGGLAPAEAAGLLHAVEDTMRQRGRGAAAPS